MAAFAVPQFNVQAGQNTIGPVTSPGAVAQATFDLEMSALLPLQPLNPPIIWDFQKTEDNGVTWQSIQRFDIVSLGLKRDGSANNRLSMSVASSPAMPAGTRFRCIVDSPIAFHSGGGTLTVI